MNADFGIEISLKSPFCKGGGLVSSINCRISESFYGGVLCI